MVVEMSGSAVDLGKAMNALVIQLIANTYKIVLLAKANGDWMSDGLINWNYHYREDYLVNRSFIRDWIIFLTNYNKRFQVHLVPVISDFSMQKHNISLCFYTDFKFTKGNIFDAETQHLIVLLHWIEFGIFDAETEWNIVLPVFSEFKCVSWVFW